MSEPLPPLPLHELRPFLHGIQADPEDDLALRALGDWLEEIGDARAELVRAGLYGDLTAVRRWSAAHGPAWWGALPDGVRLEVRRGLIELVWPTRQLAASRLLTAIDGGELGSGLVLQRCDLVIRQSSVPH